MIDGPPTEPVSSAPPSGADALVLPARMAQSQGWRAALLASLALHAALLAGAILYFTQPPYGAGGVQLEGIAIEITSAAALDSLLKTSQPTGGDTAAPSEVSGQSTSQDTPPSAMAHSDQQSSAPVVLTAPTAETPIAAAPLEPKAAVEDQPPETLERAPQTTAMHAADKGGSLSEAAQPSPNSSASTGAAPGDIQRYAREVRRVLTRSRPGADWPSGSLNLAFSISNGGDVAKAEVSKPSGNTQLDKRALAWILATRFPTPPVGLPLAQRTYTIPVTVERRSQ